VTTVLFVGGLLHLGWGIFHLLFPKVFGWSKSLASLDPLNQGVMKIMNLCLVFGFLSLSYLSLVHGGMLLAPGLGRIIISLTGLFWVFRFVLQLVFFKPGHPVSILLSVFFLLTAAAYLYPFWAGGS
jgi:hypothetical protein